jgi:hypothetical protein
MDNFYFIFKVKFFRNLFILKVFILVDSRLSEYAPFSLESGRTTDSFYRRGKLAFNRYWGKFLFLFFPDNSIR